MIDRTKAPAVQTISSITLPGVEQFALDNGVKVYAINAGEQEVAKFELLYNAGKWYEEKNLVSDLANRMLREGTTKHTALQIADTFDFYGANVNYGTGFETGGATLYSLTKQLPQVLPLLAEVFTEPIFPETELETISRNRKQRLQVDMQKNEFLSNRHFLNALFGQQHPYGRVSEPEHYDAISTHELSGFFASHYHSSNLRIIVSGKLNDEIFSAINSCFGQSKAGATLPNKTHTSLPSSQLIQHTEKPDSVQSAIVIGNISINKTHPDFLKLSVLNTLFGGYFGSRLMSNIREEKGYTYGIYSSFVSYPHAGFFEIAAEVGKDVRDATIQEIDKEINLLRTELVEEEELQTVKNYMCGKILRSIDGPLKFSETLKGLLIYNQDTDYIHQVLQAVREVSAEELQQLAVRYFDFDKMYKVTVG